eukprot:3084081-Pyramimonas_sp.AAC.1
MLISREAMIHRLLRAAALATSLRLDRRAVPEKAPASKASRPMNPLSTKRSPTARSISPFSLLTNFHLYAYLEAMMFDAIAIS